MANALIVKYNNIFLQISLILDILQLQKIVPPNQNIKCCKKPFNIYNNLYKLTLGGANV